MYAHFTSSICFSFHTNVAKQNATHTHKTLMLSIVRFIRLLLIFSIPRSYSFGWHWGCFNLPLISLFIFFSSINQCALWKMRPSKRAVLRFVFLFLFIHTTEEFNNKMRAKDTHTNWTEFTVLIHFGWQFIHLKE